MTSSQWPMTRALFRVLCLCSNAGSIASGYHGTLMQAEMKISRPHLGTWGQVLGVHKERVNGKLGKYNSGARIVTLVPSRDIEEVPDFLDVNTMARIFTVRLTVKGLQNWCHRCRKRGHLQRDCPACSRCNSSDHATADHPQNQRPAFSTLFNRAKQQIQYNEGEDGSEVPMEDAGAGRVASMPQPAAPAPAMAKP